MSQRRAPLLSLLLLLAIPTLLVAEEAAQDAWTGWRGPNRDGISPDTGLLRDWDATPPKLLWMSDGLGKGYAGVSLAGGRIYTTGNLPDGQSVIALDAADGGVLWTRAVTDDVPRHGYDGSRCTPTIDGDRLYVVASSGAIICLRAADGEILWSKDFRKEWSGKMMSGWGFSECPLVDGDLVLCTPGGPDATIVALNKLTGDEVWRSAVPKFEGAGKAGAGYSSIVISNGGGVKQYVQLLGAGAVGVRASDGKFLWGYGDVANGTANIPTCLTAGDYVFCSSGYRTGSALLKLTADGDEVSAEEVYFLDGNEMQNHHGGMVLAGGHVYCGHGHNNGLPICVKLETGEIAWGGDQRGAGSGSAAVAYADGLLVFRYQTGEVALIEATPEEYRLRGVLTPAYQEGRSWAHPVIIGGKLYLREQDKLMCYDVAAGK
ncbi:MAG: PQQ-like beta-propeller repeat protein [Pirellulaceae bacterium]